MAESKARSMNAARNQAMSSECVLDPERFEEVQVLVGRAGAIRLLQQLAKDLRDAFGTPGPEAKTLAKQAHDMTSAAGLIGFSRFSDTCRRFEAAYKTGRTEPFLLSQLLHEREQVMKCVDAILTSI